MNKTLQAFMVLVSKRRTRKYIYIVALTAIPLFISWGYMKPAAAPLYIALIAAILGIVSPATSLTHLPPVEDDNNAKRP